MNAKQWYQRILERREKERERERERERKRALEVRPERTPLRVSRDRRGPSLSKEGRSSRRDSPPRVEATHRRHSPVKEKRREYVCKVNSGRFVDVERDYVSMDKRYPRLFISPDCSKVIVNWPKENLKLSMHTPVSFEHDFVEEENATESKEPSIRVLAEEPPKSVHGSTVWNAKMILMSGLSRNALEELSSDRSSDERLPHICNILRFGILKKDRSFMAIGGQWDPSDGGNPSVDDSSLIQTALRYAKDVTQLDLQSCRHWNRFLEIHYDRIGKDGLFSHKEVTVLFLPDLSECLPSLDMWREQWLAHKKTVSERERQLSLKKEKERSGEKKEGPKDKEMDSSKTPKKVDKSEQVKEPASSGKAVNAKKKEKDAVTAKENAAEPKSDGNDQIQEKKDEGETGEEGKNAEIKKHGENAATPTASNAKTGKKKIVRRVVKPKVTDKTGGANNAASKQTEEVDKKDVGERNVKLEITGQQDETSADPAAVKTFIRKKVIKKVPVAKVEQIDVKGPEPEVKTEEIDCSEDKLKGNSEPSSAAVVQDTSVKKTIKKKLVKKVTKRKVSGVGAAKQAVPDANKDDKDSEMEALAVNQDLPKQTADAENPETEVSNTEKKLTPKPKPKAPSLEKQDNAANSSKTVTKIDKEDKKNDKGDDEKSGSKTKVEMEGNKLKVSQKDDKNGKKSKPKDEKEKRDKDVKDESRKILDKEKEKRKTDEPPRHPGFILQTKMSKDSKLRSLSLSLDSLLEYTDNDIEESTFELSLFAESLYEMLQYQMGCRLFTFLQKLRIKFVTKRNQRKRQREPLKDGGDKKLSTKRVKTDKLPVKTADSEPSSATKTDDEKMKASADSSVDPVDKVKPDDEMNDVKPEGGDDDTKPEDEMHDDNNDNDNEDDEDDDPEEDPDEDEEMEDTTAQDKPSNEDKNEGEKTNGEAEPKKETGEKKDEPEESAKEKTEVEETKPSSDVNTGETSKTKADTGKKETAAKEAVVDKELLQAFRFFDRNRVGYIRVEDMRLIIHNLGKFLSHRDVKELVQSALLESNTGRDDRILYNKLVKMSDI